MSETFTIRKTPTFLDVVDDSGTLSDRGSNTIFGHLDHIGNKMLAVLRREITLHWFADYVFPQHSDGFSSGSCSKGRAKKIQCSPPLELCAILYGPDALSDAVGLFAANCKKFLQHPIHCVWNVPYLNPHCLSPENGRREFTFDLQSIMSDSITSFEASSNPIDLFADAALQNALIDGDPPKALSTMLYKHQKQALTFMLERERGWAMDGSQKDIWKKEKDHIEGYTYLNVVSGLKQRRLPVQFKGGLLIDAPGLGKSLSVLALISHDIESEGHNLAVKSFMSTTLLIIPKTCK